MKAHIITIGDELVKGEILDTNGAYIAKSLTSRGIPVAAILTIPDEYDTAVELLQPLLKLKENGIFIFTGGLGGTSDDITRKIVSSALKKPLRIDEQKENLLRRWYERKGRDFENADRMQAAFPEGGRLIENEVGLAYGFSVRKDDVFIFSIPGVPAEMKRMFDRYVVPEIEAEGFVSTGITEVLNFATIGEYVLDRRIRALIDPGKIRWGTRARDGIISVRFDSMNGDMSSDIERIENALGEHFLFRGDEEPAKIAADLLLERDLRLCTAESCTGGLLSKAITDIPGSSKFYRGGVVAYSNELKINLLGVSPETIDKYGAVSRETAVEMAECAAVRMSCEVALSTTGIAGPEGGSGEKPVGTVFVCLYIEGREPVVIKNNLPGDRVSIRTRSVNTALTMLIMYLKEG